jgi:hypothetical protein
MIVIDKKVMVPMTDGFRLQDGPPPPPGAAGRTP